MTATQGRQPAVGFIFVTLVLIVVGFGIIIPVLPGLVKEFEGGSDAEGARSFAWLIGSFAVVQFISAPILGALSDRFGRRKVILVALAGAAIDYVIMGLAPNLQWLFISRMIAGATAGALATCNAYIADVTPPEKRAQGFGIAGAAFGLGLAIGPALGGWIGVLHPRAPFFVAAGCVAINWLYGLLVLPESLPPAKRRKFELRRANPLGALLNIRRLPGVGGFAAMHFLSWFAQTMLHGTWVLYTTYRYQWSPGQVGTSLAISGVISAVVQMKLVGPVLRRIGEKRGVLFGFAWMALIFVGYGLATQGWMIYALVCVGALAGLAAPAAQALMTKRVPADEQGAVQGLFGGLQSLASVFAPPLAAWSFAFCIAPESRVHVPGIAFFEAAAISLVALGVAAWTLRRLQPVAEEPAMATP
jgi:DHA1 family tetracycline resistance protein-like MFS transporter